jgi:hypothetical protein
LLFFVLPDVNVSKLYSVFAALADFYRLLNDGHDLTRKWTNNTVKEESQDLREVFATLALKGIIADVPALPASAHKMSIE